MGSTPPPHPPFSARMRQEANSKQHDHGSGSRRTFPSTRRGFARLRIIFTWRFPKIRDPLVTVRDVYRGSLFMENAVRVIVEHHLKFAKFGSKAPHEVTVKRTQLHSGAFIRSQVQAFPVFELSCEGADSLPTKSFDCRWPSASDNEDTVTVALRLVQLNLNSCSSSR